MDAVIFELQTRIKSTEQLLQDLKQQLSKAEQDVAEAYGQRNSVSLPGTSDRTNIDIRTDRSKHDSFPSSQLPANGLHERQWALSQEEYSRYGRQLIMSQIGLPGQLCLRNAKVLIVGLGGLGCPAAAYLAGAGVGRLGLMDGDTVELSNLHRQIAHSTARVGTNKADSAYEYLQALNPLVRYDRHPHHLTPKKAVSVFSDYDLVLDCTDHPTSRYLISDTCVLTGKALVSASALRTDGQLIVLNNPPAPAGSSAGGPCYRCIFPRPPPAESVVSCGEGGVLGPVVGVMGVLQALEAIKVLCTKPSDNTEEQPKASMLMFSAYSNPQFRGVRMRSRRSDCAVCSSAAYINEASLSSGSLDYVAFCGVTTPINVLPSELRVSAKDFAAIVGKGIGTTIDVRDKTQFAICALPRSINVPWTGDGSTWVEKAMQAGFLTSGPEVHHIVCRFGNDSQLAAKAMMAYPGHQMEVRDLKGGLQAWREEVDPTWPDY